jgi:glycosyltransferase involved in cell wall biosynthesis
MSELLDEALEGYEQAPFDETVAEALRLGLKTLVHEQNRGYGANQKTCYTAALELGADVVVMLHPDYQYTPRLIPVLASALAVGEFDVALGSRILSGGALKGGMPLYKYIANRLLTFVQNLFTGMKLSEYHTGYRAFTRQVLETLTLEHNSDDFLFDNQMLMQIGRLVHVGLAVVVQRIGVAAALALGRRALVDVVPVGIHGQIFGDVFAVGAGALGIALRVVVLELWAFRLLGFEHQVAFQRLLNLHMQVERGKLQHANGLLQGRRHGQ